MKTNKNAVKFSFGVVSALLTVPPHANAYLDPTTGSIILQLLAAGIMGALLTIKTWWRTFRVIIDGIFNRSKKT